MESSNVNVDKLQHMVEAQLQVPKGGFGSFELPCGYLKDGVLHTSVVVHEITGVEEDIMASPQMHGVKKVTEVLSRCVKSVGPFTDNIRQIILELPVSDRVFLMFAIRRTTLGDEFPFITTCPACSVEDLCAEDLSTLTTKGMSDPLVRVKDVTLPRSGKSARFRVMTGQDEEKLIKMNNVTDEQSIALLVRTELLDGKPPVLADIKNLSMVDRNFLRELMIEMEGGIDTEIEISCVNCEHQYKTNLDIRQEGFFFPDQVRRRKKRK